MDVADWNIFTLPFHGSILRIHFIAFLDKKSDDCNEISNDIRITDSFDITGEQSNSGSDTNCSLCLPSVLVSLPA